MKARLWISSLAVALSSVVAGSVQAVPLMVAGWDFSQYSDDGVLSFDGGNTATAVLDSNYSDLVTPLGIGPNAAPYGEMYLDGQFGSTNTPLDFENDPFVPSVAGGGSLTSNQGAPNGAGTPDFNSLNLLLQVGQTNALNFAMTAIGVATVVFQADLTTVPQTGSDWFVAFAGKTSLGSTSVGVETSLDGVTFTAAPSVNFTTTDSPFSVSFGTGTSETAFLRLTFDPNVAGLQQAFLDNVSFHAELAVAPEPSTLALLMTGLAGLVVAGRRRA